MKNDTRETERQKKRYVKPEIKQVPLKPEEAVLGACKSSAVGPGLTSMCSACAAFWGS